ncbi:acyltransferase family protein [Ilumatobacter nonamiensis]|uniref:acyltransferase family protein n=1 Tax=Ilumatobacter nonamiensis TaxID=467093 RepID=UPI00034B5569|nr:acyltransferase family protein [Ilumatobacter nonamiensis]
MTDTVLRSSAPDGRVTVPALTYQPALDGVRAFAVIAVVAFHAGASWAPGGYLGVSVFFTLSGYLITTVLLGEYESSGRIDLLQFVSRRIRRLAPASLLTLGVLTVLAIAGIGNVASGEARHIRWAAAHLANWDQLATDTTYADAVSGASEQSPVLHFWSLAIEEQFYVVWPAVMIVGLAVLRRAGGLRHFVVVPGLALVLSWAFVALLASRGDAESIYLNSGSRGAEILTGCVLAAVLRFRPELGIRRVPVAPVCAGAIVLAVVLTGSSSEAWPYRGGLPIFALVSAGLIVGLRQRSRFSAAVGSRPLVWIGRRSYGIYLAHWPIFVLVPLESAGVAAHLARLGVVVALAAASYRWLEQPIRRRVTRGIPTVIAAVVGAVVVIGGTLLIDDGPIAVTAVDEIDVRDREAVAIGERPVVPVAETTEADEVDVPAMTEPATDADTTSRLVVVGDSTAVALSSGLVDWAETTDGDVQVGIAAHGACGLVRGGHYANETLDAALSMDCPAELDVNLPELLSTAPIDIVVVMVSLADTWERSWDDRETWTLPTDPEHADRVRRDYARFVDDVTTSGAERVVFVRPPVAYRTADLDEPEPAWANGSAAVVDDIARELAAERDDVELLDLRTFVEEAGLDDDEALRPDGIHWTAEASGQLAEEWLGPSLLTMLAD